MTVYKRNGAKSWSVLVELGRDTHGQRRRAYDGGFRTKREALARELEIKSEISRGTWVDSSHTTVSEYMERWLQQRRHSLKPTTYQSYASNVRNHVIKHLGSVRLQDLSASHLNDFYGLLLTSGRVKTGQNFGGPLSRTTVQYIATIVGKALKDALRAGLVVQNVAAAADKPRKDRHSGTRVKTWTSAQMAAFLDSTRHSRLHPLWVVYATTGLRRGEALGLRWNDIDLSRATASVRHTFVVVKGTAVPGTPKTGVGRQISLAPQTVDVLKGWRTQQIQERLEYGFGWNDTDLVFTQEDGSHLHPDRVTDEFRRQQRDISLPKLSLHQVRHTWATLALENGVQPKVVSENLGHSSIRVTMDVYAHVLPTMTADAVATVADKIFGAT